MASTIFTLDRGMTGDAGGKTILSASAGDAERVSPTPELVKQLQSKLGGNGVPDSSIIAQLSANPFFTAVSTHRSP